MRGAVLRVLGISALRWSMRYGITPFTTPCARCGEPCTTTIPIASQSFRGLMAPKCVCGHPRPPYALVRADGKDFLRKGRSDGRS